MPVTLHGDTVTGLELATVIALRPAMAVSRMDITAQAMHACERTSVRVLGLSPYEFCADPNSQK